MEPASIYVIITVLTSKCIVEAQNDPWSIIMNAGNEALYPNKFSIPLLNVSYPDSGYGSAKSLPGFHFFDVQGYRNVKSLPECLSLCNAHPPCRAMNFVVPLSRCVLLGSGVNQTLAPRALWNHPNVSSMHIYFTSGSKSNLPTYQPHEPIVRSSFGVPAIMPNIFQLKKQRIIGGTNATRNSYPWIVRLINCEINKPYSCSVCGGSLLPPDANNNSPKTSSDMILTAAHCVVESSATKPSQMSIRLGNHRDDLPESTEVLAGARRIFSHKDYNELLDNDIAIIQLQEPINFTIYVSPIRLPTKDYPTHNNTCVAAGWGRFADNSPQATTLQQTLLPIIDYAACSEKWGGLDVFNTGRICASSSSLDVKSSTCQGDSGGPLVCQETIGKSKPFVLYGLTSFGDATSCLNRPGVFTRTFAFMKWIKDVVKNANNYPDQQHTKI